MADKLNCKIIQDLLPNYLENLTSDYTSECVEQHLKECNPCYQMYELLKEDEKEEVVFNQRETKKIKKYIKKLKWIHLLIGCLVSMILAIMGFKLYEYLFITVCEPISSELIEVKELYELDNGWIYVTLDCKEPYWIGGYGASSFSSTGIELNEIGLRMTTQRIPKIITDKKKETNLVYRMIGSFVIDPTDGKYGVYFKEGLEKPSQEQLMAELKNKFTPVYSDGQFRSVDYIYYEGKNEDDRLLIWERGMELAEYPY